MSRPRGTWLVVAVGVLALLAGCGAGGAPEYLVAQGDGADGRVGDVVLRDAQLRHVGPVAGPVVHPVGGTAVVQATIVNTGGSADLLVAVGSPVAATGVVVGDAALPAGNVLTAGYTGPVAEMALPGSTEIALRLTGLLTPVRAGLTYPVEFRFLRAGTLRLELPVGLPGEPRVGCGLPPDGREPMVLTAPLGAPVPPAPSPGPACPEPPG